MALLIENITSESDQLHTIIAENAEVTLRLRYQPASEFWSMDVTFNNQTIYGVQLSIATLHIRGMNWPFDFVVESNDNSGIPPFKVDDFASGRCSMYFVTRSEMLSVRGLDVPA